MNRDSNGMLYYTSGTHSANLARHFKGSKPRIYVDSSALFLNNIKSSLSYSFKDSAIINGTIDVGIGTHAQLGGIVTSSIDLTLAKSKISQSVRNSMLYRNSPNKINIFAGVGEQNGSSELNKSDKSYYAINGSFSVESIEETKDLYKVHGYGAEAMLDVKFDPYDEYYCIGNENLVGYLKNNRNNIYAVAQCACEAAGIACSVDTNALHYNYYPYYDLFDDETYYTCRQVIEWFLEYTGKYAKFRWFASSNDSLKAELYIGDFSWMGVSGTSRSDMGSTTWEAKNIVNMECSRIDTRCCGVSVTYKNSEYFKGNPDNMSDPNYDNVYIKIKNDDNPFIRNTTAAGLQTMANTLYGMAGITPVFDLQVAAGIVYGVGYPVYFQNHSGLYKRGRITHITYNLNGPTTLQCESGFGGV